MPEKNSFWLRQACQSNRKGVNHPTRNLSTLSPATNHNQTIIFQVYRMLFVLSSSVLTQLSPLVLSSSHPLILSLHEAHTHSANVASAYSDFINLRGSLLRESVNFQTISNLCWVFLLLLPLFIRYFILFSCDFCTIGSDRTKGVKTMRATMCNVPSNQWVFVPGRDVTLFSLTFGCQSRRNSWPEVRL